METRGGGARSDESGLRVRLGAALLVVSVRRGRGKGGELRKGAAVPMAVAVTVTVWMYRDFAA